MNLVKGIFLVLTITFLFSCEDKKDDFDSNFGYEYYPIKKGNYWVYKVDSVLYKNLGNDIISSTSYIREEIVESFVDQLGDTIHRIERRFSYFPDKDWLVTDEWATHLEPNRMTRTEENLKYIKMVFPLVIDKQWDGNAFVDKKTEITIFGDPLVLFLDWKYKVLSLGEMDTVLGKAYEKVVTIQNADTDGEEMVNATQHRYVIEKYSKDIGLIYKKQRILDTDCTALCDSLTWEEKAEKGFIMEMSLVEYGK